LFGPLLRRGEGEGGRREESEERGRGVFKFKITTLNIFVPGCRKKANVSKAN
jgi:hypothetical protein